jgi:hypothetical protein
LKIEGPPEAMRAIASGDPKPRQNFIFAGVLLILTFVNEPAAIGYEYQEQDTRSVVTPDMSVS